MSPAYLEACERYHMKPKGNVIQECLNPNARPEILLMLAGWGYHEVRKNPVLPLLALENPRFLLEIEKRLQRYQTPQLLLF